MFIFFCNINFTIIFFESHIFYSEQPQWPQSLQVFIKVELFTKKTTTFVIDQSLVQLCYVIYHGHGLFLQFFGFFRSVEDLFTSVYYAGNQAVKQEASL